MSDRTFTLPELALLVDVEYRTLHTWIRRGLLAASREQAQGSGTRNVFDCSDALEAYALADLRRAGVDLFTLERWQLSCADLAASERMTVTFS